MENNEPDQPSIEFEIDPTPQAARCLQCGKEFQTQHRLIFGGRTITPSLCNECDDLRLYRIDQWIGLCPFEFRLINGEGGGNTSLKRMDVDSPGWRKILEWKFDHKGLLIRGETGRCKTRAMWRLLKKQFDNRRSIKALTAAQFDRQCRDAGGNFTLSAWFDRLANVDLLFLDDIGKAKWTDGTEAQIFDLIDERTRQGRPILATSNDTGTTLAEKLSANRGEPLVRRLRDYCETMVFSSSEN